MCIHLNEPILNEIILFVIKRTFNEFEQTMQTIYLANTRIKLRLSVHIKYIHAENWHEYNYERFS